MSASCGIVVFNYATWSATYPNFADVPPTQVDGFFLVAETILDNTACSPVVNLTIRANLLNLLVAHIAQLFGPSASPLVGRISNASEGSVSVGTDMGTQPPGAAWYMQTQYGALYWTATAPYRTARYRPGPQPYPGVAPFRGFGGWRQ